jgi:hypothetical protein
VRGEVVVDMINQVNNFLFVIRSSPADDAILAAVEEKGYA